MAPGVQYSPEKRAAIVALRGAGFSLREIVRLQAVSLSVVHKTLQRYQETGGYCDRPRAGAPRKTTPGEDRFIISTSKRNRFLSARDIRAELLQSRSETISLTTIKHRLRGAGLRGRIASPKPLPINRKKRIAWAKEHKDWTASDWKKVLFTDESKVEIFNARRRRHVRRRDGERMLPACVAPTVKHGGGSVMVWGCFGGGCVGDLIRIEGRMDARYYHKVLVRHAVPSGKRLLGRGFIFQQDKDPKHMSRICSYYLRSKESKKELKIMTWPPQSPDCNPIELLWDHLDRAVRDRTTSSADNLWAILTTEWASLSQTILEKLTNRMPRVCKALIAARGNFFDEGAI